nr:structural protein [Trichoderma polysporum fusagravirus]
MYCTNKMASSLNNGSASTQNATTQGALSAPVNSDGYVFPHTIYISRDSFASLDGLAASTLRLRGSGQPHRNINYALTPFPANHSFICSHLSKTGKDSCSGKPEGFPILNDSTVSASPGLCFLLPWVESSRYCVLRSLGHSPLLKRVKRLYDTSPNFVKRGSAKIFFSRGCINTPRGAHYHHLSKPTPSQKAANLCDSVTDFFSLLDSSHDDCLLGITPADTPMRKESTAEERVRSTGLRPSAERASPPIQALGGVREVPTSLIIPRLADGYTRRWDTNIHPTQMLNDDLGWALGANMTDISVTRTSTFVYHFPAALNVPRLPEVFDVDHHLRWWKRADVDEPTVFPTKYRRPFQPVLLDRIVRDEFAAIGQVLSGNMSSDILKEADSVAAFSRAMGSRGQRLIPGWEASVTTRWQRFRDFGTRQRQSRQHLELAFRMVTRFTLSKVSENVLTRIQECERWVTNTTSNADIIFINAETIVPPPPAQGVPPQLPVNGEDQFWLPHHQQALLEGRAQFVDCEGMQPAEIAQLLGCIDSTGRDNVPILQNPLDDNITLVPTIARHTFPNGVTTIFVHMGNSPIPTQVEQLYITEHTHDYPDHTILGTLMRSLSLRHGLQEDFVSAIDMAVYRAIGYTFEDCYGTAAAKATLDYIDSTGSTELHLPRNITGGDYFDVFFLPQAIAPELECYITMPTKHLVSSLSLASHARVVSYNWAAKAGSLVGDLWSAPPVGGQNQYIRNHADKWLRMYYSDINIWAGLAANAQATQFGYCASPLTRRTEACRLIDWWRSYSAPYISNHYHELWMMQLIPTFQVLPYFDERASTSHVRWIEGSPDQTDSRVSFRQDKQIRLAREFEAFPGHTWIGDGGAEYNVQFYLAQGNNGQFAYEGGQHKLSLHRWDAQYIRQFPAAPQAGRVITIDQPNGRFADFALPGSLSSYQFRNDRIQNWGVSDNPRRPLTNQEASRWWDASRGLAHTSLMINYVSPIAEHVEIDPLADYSVIIWENDSGFAGMTYMNAYQVFTDTSLPLDRALPPQDPFTMPFDSSPKPFESNQPTRITSRGKVNRDSSSGTPANQASTNSIGDVFASRVAFSGRIDYETKYPITEDELPKMHDITVNSSPRGVYATPTPTPLGGRTPRSRLERLKALEEEADKEYALWAQEEQQKSVLQAARVARRGESSLVTPHRSTKRNNGFVGTQDVHQRDRAPLPSSISVQSSKSFRPKVHLPPPPSPHQMVYTPTRTSPPVLGERAEEVSRAAPSKQVRFSGDANRLPSNVEPNDAAAALTQAQAEKYAMRSPVGLGYSPANIIAGSRHSSARHATTPGQDNLYMTGARSLADELGDNYDQGEESDSQDASEYPDNDGRISTSNFRPQLDVQFGDLDWKGQPQESVDTAIERFGQATRAADNAVVQTKN